MVFAVCLRRPFTAFSFIIFCCLSIRVPDHCTHFSLLPNWVAMQCRVVRSPATVTCPLSLICPPFWINTGVASPHAVQTVHRSGDVQYFLLARIGLTYSSLLCLCWYSCFFASPSLRRLPMASESCFNSPLQVIRGSWTTSTQMALTVPLDHVMATQGTLGAIFMSIMPPLYAPLCPLHIYNKCCMTVNMKFCCRPPGFPELVWSLCCLLLNKIGCISLLCSWSTSSHQQVWGPWQTWKKW